MSMRPHPLGQMSSIFTPHPCPEVFGFSCAGRAGSVEKGVEKKNERSRSSRHSRTVTTSSPPHPANPPRPQLASGHKEAWTWGLKKSSGIVSPLALQGCYMSLIWNREQISWASWLTEEETDDFRHLKLLYSWKYYRTSPLTSLVVWLLLCIHIFPFIITSKQITQLTFSDGLVCWICISNLK